MSKVLTTLLVRDRKFYITTWKGELPGMIGTQKRYVAIEDKYLDKDMKLTQTLNGFQMHAEPTLNACIETTRTSVEVDWRVQNLGESIEKALYEVMFANKSRQPVSE